MLQRSIVLSWILLTVFVLRILFQMAPPVNYALALSSIRLRDYVLGSLLGLTPVILLVVIFFNQVMRWADIPVS